MGMPLPEERGHVVGVGENLSVLGEDDGEGRGDGGTFEVV